MFLIELDLSQFDKAAEEWGRYADQLPFALSKTLNDAAFKTRQVLVTSTWPKAVEVHNANFISAALRVIPSTKTNLSVVIYDQLLRGNLALHAKGGVKTPRRARHLAIPLKGWARRTAHGVSKSQTIDAIIANTPKRALRIIPDKGIFVGEGGRLHLRYSFKTSAQQPRDVEFYRDFEYTMTQSMRTGFVDAMNEAIATRR